jgi:hypothetical protein
MDQTLLQTRDTPPLPDAEVPAGGNNENEAAAQQQFRELEVGAAQLPLRMRIEPPMEFDGEKYGVLIFDFDAMTGKDFQRAEREFNHRYKPEKDEVVLPEMKHLYHQIIAAHRANVPLGVIQKLPRRYYTPLRVEVLKACGSSPEEAKA